MFAKILSNHVAQLKTSSRRHRIGIPDKILGLSVFNFRTAFKTSIFSEELERIWKEVQVRKATLSVQIFACLIVLASVAWIFAVLRYISVDIFLSPIQAPNRVCNCWQIYYDLVCSIKIILTKKFLKTAQPMLRLLKVFMMTVENIVPQKNFYYRTLNLNFCYLNEPKFTLQMKFKLRSRSQHFSNMAANFSSSSLFSCFF